MRTLLTRLTSFTATIGVFMFNKLNRSARRLFAGMVSVVALGFAGTALAEPALWAIKDKDSTIYLFGTVHVLKPDTQWRSA